ncbi:MAG: PH domain-containing protein [Sphingobacterium sp.]
MSVANFLQDGQDTKVVEKIHVKILDMLGPSEQIQYIAVQKKPAVTLLPDSITISDKRIFLCEFTKLGLATNFEIFTWENIKDIAFKEEIFGSKVTVIPFTGENLTVDYIPKVQARKLYQLIKLNLDELNKPKPQMPRVENTIPQVLAPKIEKDQSVQVPATSSAGLTQKLDENPIRRHNETLPVGEPAEIKSNSTPTIAVPGLNATEDDELTRKLKKLKSLYDRQLITQMEYENKKLELLSQL